MAIMETVLEIPAEHERNIFGSFDANIKKIERSLNVTMVARDGNIKLVGDASGVKQAESILTELLELSKRGNTITEQNVNYILSLAVEHREGEVVELDSDIVCRTIQGKPIKPKTSGQKNYIDLIRKKMIVFGIGPAGTGKTYLAVVFAVAALKNNEVKKIILTRPAVEAGENLGFLPGDLKEKVDPYLRPLYDALYDMLGVEQTEKLMEIGVIEIAPLAYMRGRTLEDAYVILDEAQNTTDNQMKMFLTRLGFRSKMIITGDISQIDLPRNTTSGLIRALDILEGVKGISFIHLSAMDVVRHPVVQRIIERYDGNNE